ncbi:MAG: histidine phosphatase family protein [Pseudomonadota bacterium]|nr:histidine phosphatase family protein [Pseudomonadota bacterium]
MRYLRLIRHAKSRDQGPGQSDHDRTLAPRGERDGLTMQSWLASQPHSVEWIWASSAIRAQQTASYVAQATKARLITEPTLYLASADTIIDVIRSTPADVESVAVVAHNPGLTYVANTLGPEAVTSNLATFGTVLFAVESDWAQLVPGYSHFVSLHTSKTIDRLI